MLRKRIREQVSIPLWMGHVADCRFVQQAQWYETPRPVRLKKDSTLSMTAAISRAA